MNPYSLLGAHGVSGGLATRISGLTPLGQAIGAEKNGRSLYEKKFLDKSSSRTWLQQLLFFATETDLLAWCLGPKVRSVNPYFLLGVHAVPGGLAVRISGLKHL